MHVLMNIHRQTAIDAYSFACIHMYVCMCTFKLI